MRVCIIGAGDGGSTAAIQIRRLNNEAQIDIFSKRASLGCPPCEMPITKLVQIDSCYSPHVQEDQIAVPLHRLIDKLGSGGG